MSTLRPIGTLFWSDWVGISHSTDPKQYRIQWLIAAHTPVAVAGPESATVLREEWKAVQVEQRDSPTRTFYALPTIGQANELAEAVAAVLPPEDAKAGWWCPTCKDVVDGGHVTFSEVHEVCGTFLGDCQPDEKWDRVRKALAAFQPPKKENA